MEPDAAWVPYSFQLANRTMEPAAGFPFPAGSEPTEIYGSWIQTCVPDNASGGQLVQYYAAAATTQHYPIDQKKEAQDSSIDEVVLHNMDMEICDNPIGVFEEVAQDFEADIAKMEEKIHRYPTMIKDLGDRYTVPRTVAIGPYHQSLQKLKKAEQVKHVAAYHCISDSGCSVLEMYGEVALVADGVRRHYDKDAMRGISRDDFRHMMFFDACFLVQFMLWYTKTDSEEALETLDPSLRSFFFKNRSDIYHDVWLLENQLPWKVVKAVMQYTNVDLEAFVAPWIRLLQDRHALGLREESFVLDHSYEPPHLLGLLRYHIVGRREVNVPDSTGLDSLSFSVSAVELAEIGITVTANRTGELADMGLKEGILFAELSLAPLSLNYARASRLVNMAALELSVTPSFFDADPKDSAVCSYLLLLSMLVHREEDVHQLRRGGVLQGGAGLTDKQALDFFTSFQSLPDAWCCTYAMVEIQSYRGQQEDVDQGARTLVQEEKHHLRGRFSFCYTYLYLWYTCRYLSKTQVSQVCLLTFVYP